MQHLQARVIWRSRAHSSAQDPPLHDSTARSRDAPLERDLCMPTLLPLCCAGPLPLCKILAVRPGHPTWQKVAEVDTRVSPARATAFTRMPLVFKHCKQECKWCCLGSSKERAATFFLEDERSVVVFTFFCLLKEPLRLRYASCSKTVRRMGVTNVVEVNEDTGRGGCGRQG